MSQFSEMTTMLTSTVVGGFATWAMGGDFIQGAIMGLKIGMLNHGFHSRDLVYEEGQTIICLPDVIVEAKRLQAAQVGNIAADREYLVSVATLLDCAATSLKNNAGNSTLGSNGKIYYHSSSERGFNGNQYVKTWNLKQMGGRVAKITGNATKLISAVDIIEAYKDDRVSNDGTYYHTQREIGKIALGMSGTAMGAQIGAKLGTVIGLNFCGVGAIPGAIIGGCIGGIIGNYIGESAGAEVVDLLYNIY